MEKEPQLPMMRLHLSDGIFESTPRNTMFEGYLGALALYNHIALDRGIDPNDGYRTFGFIFEDSPMFKKMFKFMASNEYPMLTNQVEVAPIVMQAFTASHPDGQLNLPKKEAKPAKWTQSAEAERQAQTTTGWLFDYYYNKVAKHEMTRDEAQSKILAHLRVIDQLFNNKEELPDEPA